MSLKKLNAQGISHVAALAFVVVVGLIGTAYLVVSHADSVDYTTYLTVNTTTVTQTLNRGNSNTLLMQNDHAGYTEGMIYGPGFTIHNKTASGYEIYNSTPAQGFGFYESSGGMTAGQTVKIHTYINPNKADGTYTGSIILKYYDNSTSTWQDGPTINYTLTLVTGAYSKYFTINGNRVVQTFSRSQAAGGFVYAPGITLTGVSLTGYTFYPNQVQQGQGFYDSSGGLAAGQSFTARVYLNTNLANGVYTGSDTLKYQDAKGVYHNGPTVYYTLTLTN